MKLWLLLLGGSLSCFFIKLFLFIRQLPRERAGDRVKWLVVEAGVLSSELVPRPRRELQEAVPK